MQIFQSTRLLSEILSLSTFSTVKGKTITLKSMCSYLSKDENDIASCILYTLNESETLYHIVSVCPSYTLERQHILGRLIITSEYDKMLQHCD